MSDTPQDEARQLIYEANEVLCKLLNEENAFGEADRLTLRLMAWLEKPESPQSETAESIDTKRMNWLETMNVEVRVSMRWGSRQLFLATPNEIEGAADEPSDIREQIDREIAKEASRVRR
jgi:hypothetical protein